MLQVVENQQEVLVRNVVAQCVAEFLPPSLAQAQRIRDRQRNLRWVRDWRQINEDCPMREVIDHGASHGQCQTSLAGAARADQCQQAHRRSLEHLPRSSNITFAANKLRWRHG